MVGVIPRVPGLSRRVRPPLASMTKEGSPGSTCAHPSAMQSSASASRSTRSAFQQLPLLSGRFSRPVARYSSGMTHRDAVGPGLVLSRAPKKDWARAGGQSERRWRVVARDHPDADRRRLMEDYFAPARITPYGLDYEMLVIDRPRSVVSVLQALSCSPDNIHPPSRAAARAYRTQPLRRLVRGGGHVLRPLPKRAAPHRRSPY